VKALITGAGGQLGQALVQSCPPGVQATAHDRVAFDIGDSRAIEERIDQSRPDVIVNAAAYTAVDRAESEPERAYAINADAVGVLAQACSRRGIRLIHVSTDFVFDGGACRPYAPDDATRPLSVYGTSKLQGERRIMETETLDWRIVRTAWVYASYGRNFMLTMLRLFRERGEAKVVADQVGTPTSARSLAHCVWCAALERGANAILHYTDAGVASWYDFAVAIAEEARALELISKPVSVVPIATEDYPTPACRPAYSVLDKRGTLSRLGLDAVHWRVRLREVLEELPR